MLLIDSNVTAEQFESLILEEMASAPESDKFIAVDTEFIREKSEKPQLCLVQIATPLNVYIIDAIAIGVDFLRPLFASSHLLKVLHSARQDLEILHYYSIQTENFRDTQLQEMILSNSPPMSYQLLVSKYLGRNLDKDYTLSDWEKRPLTQEQLDYAAADVIYLRDVHKMQWRELVRLARVDWIQDELSRLQPIDSSEKTGTVKAKLGPNAFLRHQLMKWRKQRAQALDIREEAVVPRRFINTILKKGGGFIGKMKKSRQISDKNLLDFLEFAETLFDSTPKIVKFRNNALFYAVKVLLEVCANGNNVAAQMLATSTDIERILDHVQAQSKSQPSPSLQDLNLDSCDIKCLQGWRKKVFGDIVLEFLKGNVALAIDESEVIVRPINDGGNHRQL